MMEKAFYFILKIFKFLPWLSGDVENLEWKDKINFKVFDVTTLLINNSNTHIAQYLTK